MLDNLILAYRNKFYDWNLKEAIEFYKKNKIIFLKIILVAFSLIITFIFSIINSTNVPLVIFIGMEMIVGFVLDRRMVKKHQQYISKKEDHINNVIIFLKTVIPDHDLYSKRHVIELIDRLSMRIDADAPFRKYKIYLYNFGKNIVFPIITYIAGVYTTNVSTLEVKVVATWALVIVLIIGLGYIIVAMFFQMLQKIICRDYDASIALKEDLLDIQLLFFINDN